ncbi:MAG TPA: zf-HC2 domain-containing protein [Candidatus Cybelea sp.]|nr:zf-HC2 domain-containing protein [Candidatus Cybelea sp.]
MNCRQAQSFLPGYLDGIRSREHVRVSEHLDSCAGCREQLERFRRLAICLAHVQPVAPPADLATRIRVEVSQAGTFGDTVQRWSTSAKFVFKNILEPLAVPAAGGIVTALVVFVLVVQNTLGGVPMGIVPNDLPLNIDQPAYVESLAPFAVPGILTDEADRAGAMTIEATLNAQGDVVSYRILSGPNDAAVRRQIDQVLLFSRFRPRLSFGRPADGGHVMIGFSEVRVRG